MLMHDAKVSAILMIRKSFDNPCPMKIHPLSTSRRSFLYTTFKGVKV